MSEKVRCSWANPKNPLYIRYHDEEWGVPIHDDHKLFEMLILESFQAGLSWECILNKREAFRQAFDGFDLETVCGYGEEKLEKLMQEPSIVRNKLKIRAAVNNARVFKYSEASSKSGGVLTAISGTGRKGKWSMRQARLVPNFRMRFPRI